jgi:hypothetical protein
MIDDVRVRGLDKRDDPSELRFGQGFGAFSGMSAYFYQRAGSVLLRDCADKCSRLIDSTVSFPELHNSQPFFPCERGECTIKNKTKNTRKIKPLIINEVRNAESELPPEDVLSTILFSNFENIS